MIKISKFKKYYKNNLILDISEFCFIKNKSYLIVGTNGSGKSTLIKCIMGINQPTLGEIIVKTKNIAYIPEKYYYPEFCTINQFLKSILGLYNLEHNVYLIDYYCVRLNIDKNKIISKLSKGMQQKVLIIQALIHNADLFIFDEPLNGLDNQSQKIFFEIINEIKKNNKTLIITTHYPSLYKNSYDFYVTINNKGLFCESI